MPRPSKLQRWTDLLAALLRRHYPATFEELARDVPAYAEDSKKKDAVMRMFERDKDELRSFGIAIETVSFGDEESSGYKLDRKGFYLPYLSLAGGGGKAATKPRKPDKFGYRALETLVFEPDELSIIAAAAARVRSLGDPVLAEEAGSAMRKLAFDLPLPEVEESPVAYLAYSVAEPSLGSPMRAMSMDRMQNVFEVLNDALARRKRIRFDYRTMESDRIARRHVEPFGLFFLSSRWYLAGNDLDRGELRNFRLDRIRDVEVNQARSHSADYSIAEDFNLREHARSKQAWELGDGAADDAVVEFLNPTGAAKAAARLGLAIEGAGDRRKFRFRRMDSFARWLLSFGGEAVPLSPQNLVNEFEKQVRETRGVYGTSP